MINKPALIIIMILIRKMYILCFLTTCYAQDDNCIRGVVINSTDNTPITVANIYIVKIGVDVYCDSLIVSSTGYYSFSSLKDGIYSINISSPIYNNIKVDSIEVYGNTVKWIEIQTTPLHEYYAETGQETYNYYVRKRNRIWERMQNITTDTTATIFGLIEDNTTGKRLKPYTILIINENGQIFNHSGRYYIYTSDRRGLYYVTNIPKGLYRIAVQYGDKYEITSEIYYLHENTIYYIELIYPIMIYKTMIYTSK